MMKEKYSIDDILEAVQEIEKKDEKNYGKKDNDKNKDEIDIPINTLKLIEEAEKNIK